MSLRRVTVSDRMQRWYRYELVAPMGKQFAPTFAPELSPKEMLALGIFGGVYLRDCTKEFPKDWFTHAKFQKEGVYAQDPKLNYFGVRASQPLSVWQAKGWIYEDDPRGWFQWYCRYWMGRRLPIEDARQIRRWRAMQRHVAQIKKRCRKGDVTCYPKQRQALLHWAHDSRKL